MFGKQLKTYCGKCNKGEGFWGWHEEKNHNDNYVPKQRDNAHKHKNSRIPQLQLDDDMKKALNTLIGGMGDTTDASKPDFYRAERQYLNIMSTLGNSSFYDIKLLSMANHNYSRNNLVVYHYFSSFLYSLTIL